MNRRKFLLAGAALPAVGFSGSGSTPPTGVAPAGPRDPRHPRDPRDPRDPKHPGNPGLPSPPSNPHDEEYWHELRWHFFIPSGHAYCNTSTLGASPRVVVNAIHDHTKFAETQLSGCHYRSGHPSFLGGYQDEPTLRARIGKIMGCSMQEIALTRNATMGMSYIAQGLELGAGDEVIMTDQEHAGGRSAYDVRVRRDGIKIVEVTMPSPANDPEALVQAFRAAITDSTKVLAIPHITSAFGTVLPVKRIIAAARARRPDLYVVLDGAQALGHVPVDVRDFDCDAYFSSPHKWVLSPKGTGVLYVRKATNRRVWTTVASSEWDFREDVGRRFTQIGTGNQSLNKGFEAALDFLERIGIATIHSRIKALGDRLRAGLARIDGVTVQSSTHAELCAGITNYKVPGWQAQDAVEHLYSTDRIMPRAVADGIRQSLHIYTTFEDVDRTLARIEKMKR